ncbi:MAG TPA: HDOD domain-containing protein, partial [Spirochaetota bacterium]|nr:HDOD domain-containing protein [Spirochaetota bacterium]
NYIEDLLEYTDMSDNEILGSLEEISKDQKEYLIDDKMQRKRKSAIDLTRDIKRNVLYIYEAQYFETADKLYLSDLLKNILLISGKSNITNPLIFALDELIEFFQIANYKRVYFEHKNINIDLRYSLGILNFNASLKENYKEFKEKIKSKNSKIRVTYQVFGGELIITASNDYRLHKEEIKEINEQIQTGKKNINLKEVLKLKEYSLEQKKYELIAILLFLKKFGIEKSLRLSVSDNESKFVLAIPLNSITEDDTIKLSEEIVKEIDKIPQIPEHIKELKKKIDDPKSDIAEIEKIILKDPAMTADILKTANSSYYSLGKEINTIREAIKIVGLKAINNIILATSGYKVLNDRVSKEKMEAVIKHSEKTAFFAKELLKYKKISIDEDDIYLASLLHDIGKILVEGVNPGVYEKLQNIFQDKKLSVDYIEDLAGGLNHALIGGMISVKWNFPDIVTEIIRCHHNPRNVNKYPDAVFVVYLANMLTHYIDKKSVYENIDENALEFLEIESEETLKKISAELVDKFNRYKRENG